MTDPVADMLTRIRNAIAVRSNDTSLPYSKIKHDVAEVLVNSGFLQGVSVDSSGKHKQLQIQINDPSSSPSITEVKRLSRPGQRHYVKSSKIPKVRRGRGIVVISTSQGVMTGEDARAKQLGGELICEVY